MTVSPFHIQAEIAAWPFWSPAAFGTCTRTLAQRTPGQFDSRTDSLANALAGHLRGRRDGQSVEALRATAMGVWFGQVAPLGDDRMGRPHSPVSLHEFVCRLATNHLRISGDRIVVRERLGDPVGEGALRWRWLSLALPADLLVSALCAAEGVWPRQSHVSVAPLALDRLLSAGLDQLHLHLGAAVPFDLLWTHLMLRCATGFDAKKLGRGSTGELPFGGILQLRRWLVVAAISRLVMGGFLWRLGLGATVEAEQFLRGKSIVDATSQRNLIGALASLSAKQSPAYLPATAALEALYRRLGGIHTGDRAAKSVLELQRRDPLYAWLCTAGPAAPAGSATITAETWLLVNGLDYLRRRATGSHLRRDFARLFWQYVRIRGRTYRYVVQDPGVCGLDWFSQRYLRMTGLRDGMGEGVQLDSALALESRDVRLHSLEVRTSPEARWMRNRDLCRAVRSATVQGRTFKSDHLPGEIGLVLHFVKQPIDARGRCHGDPRAHHCRYGSYFRARRQEALAIVGCLRREPKLLRWLRGIDVCNLEISIPSWVIGPLFALVRQETDTIAAHSGEPELRATLHAGEEYTRLISGIRQVHEPLEFGTVRRGDRLGHALALGEDARSWAARSPVVVQRVEERLDDLLWELDRYQSGDLPAQAGRLEVVRTEICRLASVIFGAFSPRDERVLLAWRRRMHCWHALQTLRYPSVAAGTLPISADGAMKLLHAYLTDVGVYARSRQVLEVRPTEDEILVCTAAQRFLRQRLADFDISIEINPTSNLLIGNLRELDHHPIFQLQPLSGVPDDGEAPVRVVLGDDDPVTFSTTLVDEFAYVYFGLLRHGVGTQRAEQWLERVRLNGRRARFTIPLPRAGQVGEKSFT